MFQRERFKKFFMKCQQNDTILSFLLFLFLCRLLRFVGIQIYEVLLFCTNTKCGHVCSCLDIQKSDAFHNTNMMRKIAFLLFIQGKTKRKKARGGRRKDEKENHFRQGFNRNVSRGFVQRIRRNEKKSC